MAVELLRLQTVRQEVERMPFPRYSQPKEVGCFSINGHREFEDSASELAVYRAPNLAGTRELNLSDGFPARHVKKDENVVETLDHFLRWVVLHRQEIGGGGDGATATVPTAPTTPTNADTSAGQWAGLGGAPPSKRRRVAGMAGSPVGTRPLAGAPPLPVDFVCWRGGLRKLMTTPYCENDVWQFSVVKHNGTTFICEVETEQHKAEKTNMGPFHTKACYWGRRFEGFCTVPFGSRGLPDAELPPQSAYSTNENVGYCSVVTAKLNGKRLLFSGEVDCMAMANGGVGSTGPPPPLGRREYIELKTQALLNNDRQIGIFEKHKLLKFWAQSFLINVPRVVVGFRDRDGYVQKIQDMKTSDLPKFVKKKPGLWNPSVCMNFLDRMLDFIKLRVDEHPEGTHHTISFRNGVVKLVADEAAFKFLPDWFKNDASVATAAAGGEGYV